ncbi:MAG: hypothetical protein Q4D96_09825 [Propionibacteriaceae bacterium]|nr:hypothetical protein [Propionibacteriaceae bacterium]
MARNIFAGFLGILALLTGLIGVLLQWVNHAARDPQLTEQVAVAVAKDPTVHAAISSEVTTRLAGALQQAKLPGELPYAQIKEELTAALHSAVQEVLADQGVDTTWRTVLSQTREQLVTDLDAWRSGDPAPEVKLNLAPVATLVVDEVKAEGGHVVAVIAEHIEVPETMIVAGTQLDDRIARVASPVLQLAQLWPAFIVLAVVLVALAVAFARSSTRPGTLIRTGLGAVAVTLMLRLMVGQVSLSGQSGLAQTMAAVGVKQLTSSLSQALLPLLWVGLAVTVVGLVWWFIRRRGAVRRGR